MFKPTSGLNSKGMRRVAATDAMAEIEIETRETGLTSAGIKRVAEVSAAPLSTQQRKNLDSSQFVFPDKAPGPGSCPIPDVTHAQKALQLCTPEDVVKRKVCAKFPSMPACSD